MAKRTFKTLDELKAALDRGAKVYQHHEGYVVIKDSIGQYLITFTGNNWCCGLTWQDGVTLNGKLEEFYELTPDPWISDVIGAAIPLSNDDYDMGFRDALESVALAMGETDQCRAVIQTALDAFQNNRD